MLYFLCKIFMHCAFMLSELVILITQGVISCFKGYFDEDSMDEFIASETEESSMSLTSEDEKPKRSKFSFILL